MSWGSKPRVWSAFFVFLLAVALTSPLLALAQDEPAAQVPGAAEKRYAPGSGPAGVWVGKVEAPDGEDSVIRLTLDQAGSDWQAQLDDPLVGAVQIEKLRVTDTRVSFTFKPTGAPFPSHFSGAYLAANDRLTGTFSQRGNSILVRFSRDPDSIVRITAGPDGQPIEPARIRHDYTLALTGRVSYWAPLHVVKDEVYHLNAITEGALNYDGALKLFILDGFNLFARAFRGGQSFSSDPAKLQPFQELGLTADSTLKLDGYEFGLTGYLGNVMAKNSHFNPYLTAAMGRASWEVTEGDRGTSLIAIEETPLEGTDWCFAGGLGTEYELGSHACLEFEVLWRYFTTKDDLLWAEPDLYWGNTHSWSLSAGLTWGLF